MMSTAMHALAAAAGPNNDVGAAGAVFPRLCCRRRGGCLPEVEMFILLANGRTLANVRA